MKLKKNHEIIGKLSKIKNQDNLTIIVSTVEYEIEIPIGALSYNRLKAYLGKRIGILNIDNQYYIRHIK